MDIEPLDAFPGAPDVEEDGTTFRDNAVKKAIAIAAFAGVPAVADDSGLEVFYLNSEPGVFSARYGGPGADDAERRRLVLERLEGVPELERGARFVCALAVAWDPEHVDVVQEECRGRIALQPRGRGGFGYDPIFFVPELNMTMAELTMEQKNLISHRGKAFRSARALIQDWLARG